MKNKYIIENDYVKIFLNRRNKKENLETLIDLEDLDKVINFKYKWYPAFHKHINGYYVRATIYLEKNKSTTIPLHYFIMDCPKDKQIDHINHNTLDNRKNNLRHISYVDNSKYRKAKNSNNKTGYRNVCFVEGLYIVQLQINKKNKRLGSFKDIDEAGKFAEEMRKKYYGEYAGFN